jgi:hypothetical protein
MNNHNFRAWAETLALDLPELPTPTDIEDIANRVEKIALAAFAAGREDAAKVADDLQARMSKDEFGTDEWAHGMREAAETIAAAIRALPGKEGAHE